ncbi:MAG TPA: hypothetical protein VGU25_00155 [Acidobacteriaceae bacterium]|nr:hypothetical protein [Acidobacteriaceae bacterium]
MNKCFVVAALAASLLPSEVIAQANYSRTALASPFIPDPISVYDNWAAYDELSDNVPLTEQLSLKELDNVLRLERDGVRFDYYVMDAFWFDPDGGYRTWKKPNWPEGPDRWIQTCQKNGILPGLWFSTNTLVHLNASAKWKDSLNKNGTAMSMFEGGFLPDFMDVLQFWYSRGIRMFLFDLADMSAATPKSQATLSKQEIVARNSNALRNALADFRRKHPDVVLEAFNGFGGVMDTTSYPFPFKDPVDLRWLDVFDSLYCGDPRPSDIPAMDFWRSLDTYSDHQMRRYEESGVPLERIDTTSFMPGKTGTIYRRAFQEWKGSLLLTLARGGWINTTYGNLELLSDTDARWFARVQSLFLHFQSVGRIKTFGGIPGDFQPYGFGALDGQGSVYTVVNPTETIATITLPALSQIQHAHQAGRIIFRDSGFVPKLTGDSVVLGPEQMAVIGLGKYAASEYDLGVQNDVVIPRTIQPLPTEFHSIGKGVIEATVQVPSGADVRLIMQQYSPDGTLRRTWAGGPPSGTTMGKVFILKAEQDGRELPIHEDYDRLVWAGLSWAEGEISHRDLKSGTPVKLTFRTTEKDPVTIKGRAYAVTH